MTRQSNELNGLLPGTFALLARGLAAGKNYFERRNPGEPATPPVRSEGPPSTRPWVVDLDGPAEFGSRWPVLRFCIPRYQQPIGYRP